MENNDEILKINKFIHTQILNKCWHEFEFLKLQTYQCRCGLKINLSQTGGFCNPDYTTDLNACFEAQAKCIEMVGVMKYYSQLMCLFMEGFHSSVNLTAFHGTIATTDALTRCRAMISAIEEHEKTTKAEA